ncbi:hypothetical protein [Saccharomonospora piscinae]|uniref:hypothetical protein n=1 Tax=Saccharomonospora piscinae TaxID=687388 RepID=UPI00207BCC79|nr:hypothetical protein [Saccharomonospora piscinae]
MQEFAEYAERFARDHGEPGTLSVRHLDRLVNGRGLHGKPLGRPRPATARLLERIFGIPAGVLLSPYVPEEDRAEFDSGEEELRARLRASARVDKGLVDLLRQQLDATRVLDRQLGANVVHAEVVAKAEQITQLLKHCVVPDVRMRLAILLAETCTLAGWQALDRAQMTTAWHYYERAKHAARESGNKAFEAHATAEQAFVLIDMGEVQSAVELIKRVCTQARRDTPSVLRAWLQAAYGEVLAADDCHFASRRAFDRAEMLLPSAALTSPEPFVVLDAVHLARWRGHALARLGEAEAIGALTTALNELDARFTRAEASLRVDLASILVKQGERASSTASV